MLKNANQSGARKFLCYFFARARRRHGVTHRQYPFQLFSCKSEVERHLSQLLRPGIFPCRAEPLNSRGELHASHLLWYRSPVGASAIALLEHAEFTKRHGFDLVGWLFSWLVTGSLTLRHLQSTRFLSLALYLATQERQACARPCISRRMRSENRTSIFCASITAVTSPKPKVGCIIVWPLR